MITCYVLFQQFILAQILERQTQVCVLALPLNNYIGQLRFVPLRFVFYHLQVKKITVLLCW